MKAYRLMCCSLLLLCLLLTGCGKSDHSSGGPNREEPTAKSEEGPDADVGSLTPTESRYLDAGRPFALAIANRKYDEAFALLSSYATAQMSLNQFAPEDDEAKFVGLEKNPALNVTADKFAGLMKRTEERFGAPKSLKQFHVFSTDAKALDRASKQGLDAVDAMFAIGNMPDSVPVSSRRASLRGRVCTQLSPQELEKIAKEEGTTVTELEKNPDFEPYFTIKIVLVEEAGTLKVGYFEFLPPGIMD